MKSNPIARASVGTDGTGFSLLEVLVASLILAIVAIPLFTSLSTGHQGTERIAEESMASNLGTSLVEKLAQVPFSKLPIVKEDTPDSEIYKLFVPRAYAPLIEPYPKDYRRLVTIEQLSQRTDDPAAAENSRWGSLKMIKVKVVWVPEYLKRKGLRTLVFQTLVTDDTEVW
ncbi:MAG: prepilin-type N-terminal cleavage/methylation domain-containing protein [Candidatus Riflebacteria bacterium]|nr:prepilin-type N-terminal cleavage/methylation domain-containing protein [Candidatus Riflebacteria bacterium]